MVRRIKNINKQITRNLGRVVKENRVKNAITQASLSEKAGITRTFLSLIETGERLPSYDTLNKIATLLDTNIYALVLEAKVDKYDEDFELVNQLTKLIETKDQEKLLKLTEFAKSL